jgi:hypothetical protein
LWVCSDSVFVNDFWFCSTLCALKIWASAAELACGVDFWVWSDSIFVYDFYFCSSLCALMISASTVELVPVLISGCAATQFSSMISDSAVVYV